MIATLDSGESSRVGASGAHAPVCDLPHLDCQNILGADTSAMPDYSTAHSSVRLYSVTIELNTPSSFRKPKLEAIPVL